MRARLHCRLKKMHTSRHTLLSHGYFLLMPIHSPMTFIPPLPSLLRRDFIPEVRNDQSDGDSRVLGAGLHGNASSCQQDVRGGAQCVGHKPEWGRSRHLGGVSRSTLQYFESGVAAKRFPEFPGWCHQSDATVVQRSARSLPVHTRTDPERYARSSNHSSSVSQCKILSTTVSMLDITGLLS